MAQHPKTTMKPILLILSASTLAASAASSIQYAGGTYSQNFNSLQNGAIFTNYTALPTGWEVSRNTYVATNGVAGYSNNYTTFAFSSSIGAPDKSFGLVFGSTGQSFMGFRLQNTTGGVLRSFTLSYYAEQWVSGAVVSNDQSLPFKYSLNATSLASGTYTAVPQLSMHSIHDGNGTFTTMDGNLEQNRTLVSHTVTGITWRPNQDLWLRWDGSYNRFGSTHAMAVDDLTFSAIPEPSVSLLAVSGLAVVSGLVRIRRN